MSKTCYRYVTDETVAEDTGLAQCRLRQPRNIMSAMLAYRVEFSENEFNLEVHKGKTPSATYETIAGDPNGQAIGACGTPVIRSNGDWKAVPWLAKTGPISDWHAALIAAGYQRVPRMGYLSPVQIKHMKQKASEG